MFIFISPPFICNITVLVQKLKYLLQGLSLSHSPHLTEVCISSAVCVCLCMPDPSYQILKNLAEQRRISSANILTLSHFLKQLHNHVSGTDYNACFCQNLMDKYKV